jgi:hypothetical protein
MHIGCENLPFLKSVFNVLAEEAGGTHSKSKAVTFDATLLLQVIGLYFRCRVAAITQVHQPGYRLDSH